jgi:hypothetical protein
MGGWSNLMSVIERAEESVVEVYLDEGGLRYRSAQAITPDVRRVIVEHKEEIARHFRRCETKEKLLELYARNAELWGSEEWKTFCAIPGWRARLHKLEERFTRVWEAGGNPEAELKALQEHWADASTRAEEVRSA